MASHPSCMHPSIFKMYGRPKLIELDRMKSPAFTCLDIATPVGLIRSSVRSMYFASTEASPIFIQLIPFESEVK